MSERIVGKTKHGELTIDQLAELQPGMSRIMNENAKRWSYMYYAAQGGNWLLAAYQHREIRGLFSIAKTTRPKFAQDLSAFEEGYMKPVIDAINEKNWEKFEKAYNNAIQGSDFYHDKWGFPYVRYVVPSDPPGHLHLGPPEKLVRKKAT